VVFNNPADEYVGKDDQLDKAIEVILQELKSRKGVPQPPPYPKKNGK
jgi:tricorn protease